MIKKKLFGIGLALALVAGIITSGVVLADGPHKIQVDPVKWDSVTTEVDLQDDSGCACTFIIVDNEPPVQDPSVYSIDSATGAVKYGYRTKVKLLDCTCALNNGQIFPITEDQSNSIPGSEDTIPTDPNATH